MMGTVVEIDEIPVREQFGTDNAGYRRNTRIIEEALGVPGKACRYEPADLDVRTAKDLNSIAGAIRKREPRLTAEVRKGALFVYMKLASGSVETRRVAWEEGS